MSPPIAPSPHRRAAPPQPPRHSRRPACTELRAPRPRTALQPWPPPAVAVDPPIRPHQGPSRIPPSSWPLPPYARSRCSRRHEAPSPTASRRPPAQPPHTARRRTHGRSAHRAARGCYSRQPHSPTPPARAACG